MMEDLQIHNLKRDLNKMTYMQILSYFDRVFTSIGEHVPQNEDEKQDLLYISRTIIQEFQKRIKFCTIQRVEELAKLLQIKMRYNPIKGDTYYTRNLLRLYTHCVFVLEQRGMAKKYLRKWFL